MTAKHLLAAAWLGADVPDREAIDRAIHHVLARPEFQTPEPNAWDRLKAWFWEHLFHGAFKALTWLDLSTPLGKLIFGLLILTLLAIVVHIAYTIASQLPKRSVRRVDAGPRVPDAPLTPEAAALAAEASRHASAGRFAEAMHALYRASLLHLDDRRLARFEEHKTAGDYLCELRDADPRRHFRSLVAAFDPVAWGGRLAAAPAWEFMRAAAAQLGVSA